MASQEYLFDVHDAVRVMEDALGDVRKRLNLAMQRGENLHPAWSQLSKAAQKLARQCSKLQQEIEQAGIGQN